MEEQKNNLNIGEQESVAEAVLRIVASYPDFPKTITQKKIHLDNLKEAEGIGISPASGAVVLKTYVSGSFEAQFPFTIYYKANPTTNAAVIAKRGVLERLAEWMETMEFPALSDGREIQSITRKSSVTLAGNDEAGNAVFQCGFVLKYFKKRS